MNMFVYLDKNKLKSIIKSNKGKSYTYGLCKDSGELYYVGLGVKDRILKHHIASDIKNNKNRAKISTYLKHCCKFVIFEFNTREKCAQLEQDIIAKFGRLDLGTGILTNMTDGGEGPYGFVPSHELKLRKSLKAKENSELFRQIAIKQWQEKSDEDRAKMISDKSALMKEMWKDPEKQEIFKEAQMRAWNDPDKKGKRIKAMKDAQSSSESRENARQNMVIRWQDPLYRDQRLKNRESKLKEKQENLDSLKQDILQNETT